MNQKGVKTMENLKPIETLESILGTINTDECDVLKLFYGIKDGSEHTFEEIATILNKSADEIREIYAKAFRKLRHPSRRNKISFHHTDLNMKFQLLQRK